jgi:ABC-type spermidine/putrescine transport system permease subunit II
MNRSFLIVIVPAILVGVGYVFVMRYLGASLDLFRFVAAGVVAAAAVFLVHRYRRDKASRRSR